MKDYIVSVYHHTRLLHTSAVCADSALEALHIQHPATLRYRLLTLRSSSDIRSMYVSNRASNVLFLVERID